MELFDMIRILVAAHGPAGDEADIRRCIADLAAPFADEIRTDTLGNLIVRKKGNGPRIMFAAHMDSIGLIVTHIQEDGYLKVGRLGGIHDNEAICTPVRFKNGQCGIYAYDEKTEPGKLKTDDCCIDIGVDSREEAAARVRVGDTAVYHAPTLQTGERVFSPYLDDRIACAILLFALQELVDTPNDLYFVFTVQEEVGLRGAKTAAWDIAPDYAVAVDVTFADDNPGSKKQGTTQLGKGAAIKIMDGGVICHPVMVDTLTRLAREGDIPFQRDIIRAGRTDAAPIHLSRSGVCTGGISIPCRYMHSPAECVDLRDVRACIRLVQALSNCDLTHFNIDTDRNDK